MKEMRDEDGGDEQGIRAFLLFFKSLSPGWYQPGLERVGARAGVPPYSWLLIPTWTKGPPPFVLVGNTNLD
jgi:hypothetical protein